MSNQKKSIKNKKALPVSVELSSALKELELPKTIVAIGASAGGLEALSLLLPSLPQKLGLSFVVVQHLSPTHRSMLTQLLGRATEMPVVEIEDQMQLCTDTVYITPPNRNVTVQGKILCLAEPPREMVPKPSVNLFFASLAEQLGENTIGIVLSGTGSDGAAGLHAIKAAGGYTFAQSPATAKYDGMPRAAIDAGGVDWILSPDQMGAEIARIVQRGDSVPLTEATREQTTPTLLALLRSLYAHTRVDFTGYKEGTLWRRIERRMTAVHCTSLEQYLAFTETNTQELERLAQDMLISVTSFFRDKAAFAQFGLYLDKVLKDKKPGEDIRAWIPGCASGEEVFSIAILILEALGQRASQFRIQIFATDIDEVALNRARSAIYPITALSDIENSWVERYFTQHAEGYEVKKNVRELVLFARHNLVQDPPFLRLDLISCRNVLIYLQPELQARLLSHFNYALRSSGLLFLGRSESVFGHEELFEVVDKDARLYQRRGGVRPFSLNNNESMIGNRTSGSLSRPSLEDVLIRATAKRFSPAAVLIDMRGVVRQLYGNLDGILNLPQGRASFELMTLVRRELRPELAQLIRQVQTSSNEVDKTAVKTEEKNFYPPMLGRVHFIKSLNPKSGLRLSVQKLISGVQEPLLLVCFEWVAAQLGANSEIEIAERAADNHAQLEQELAATREHLQTLIEELETSNEETQALNEEIQASNEELQASNEELEASNEELQAANEELTTVNEELQTKSTEMQQLYAELENIYSSVDYPLLAFDERLDLRRVNRAGMLQLKFDIGQLGKPLHLLPWPEGMPSLREDMEQVLVTRTARDRQVVEAGHRHWALHMLPRLKPDGKIAGLLMMMVDNTKLYETERKAHASHTRLLEVMNRSALLVAITDVSGRFQFTNPVFERFYGLQPNVAVGKTLSQILPSNVLLPFRDAQLEAVRSLEPVSSEEQVLLNDQTYYLLGIHFPLLEPDGAINGICYQALDITERKAADAQSKIAAIVESSRDAIIGENLEGKITTWNPAAQHMFGYSAEEIIGKPNELLIPPEKKAEKQQLIERLLKGEALESLDTLRVHKNGQCKEVSLSLSPILDSQGTVIGISAALHDISARKRAEVALKISQMRARSIFELSPGAMLVVNQEGVIEEANSAAARIFGFDGAVLQGMKVEQLIPEQLHTDHEQRRLDLHNALQIRMLTKGYQLKALRADGTEFPIKIGLSPLQIEGQTSVIVSLVDLSEQAHAHEALVKARNAAEDAARTKSAFLANMSHEIRTPMNAILGLSKLTLDTALPEAARSHLEKLHNSASALMGILDDVLDYSKIEAGQLRFEAIAVSLEEILQRVNDLFGARIEQKGLQLMFDLSPDLPKKIMADPLRLSQVLNNLVGNAVKFTEKGSIYISVQAMSDTSEQDCLLRFAVRDTGIGISPDQQIALFEAFTQADNSVTRRFGGTGLGLAICKNLVQMMNGHIGVNSQLGEGCEFWFTARFALINALEIDQPNQQWQDKKTLVVSAHQDLPEALIKQLNAKKISSQHVSDSKPALASTENFDVVIWDYTPKFLPSAALLEKWRASATPVLALVPLFSQPEDLMRQYGFKATLTKPVLPSALFNALQALLEIPTNNGQSGSQTTAIAVFQTGSETKAQGLQQRATALKGLNVLLAEDNPINQLVAQEFLERLGLVVTLVENGQQAVDVVKQAAPDFFAGVLMDLHMPVMDGLEATREIHQLPHALHLPVVAMTAAALPEDRARCLEAGMVDHVSKPIVPEQLVEILLQWFAPKNAPLFAFNELKERLLGNEKLAHQMAKSFVEQERNALTALQNALSQHDLSGAQKLAHSLKGSAGTVGALALQQAALTLENTLKAEQPAHSALQDLHSVWTRTCDVIKQYTLPSYEPER